VLVDSLQQCSHRQNHQPSTYCTCCCCCCCQVAEVSEGELFRVETVDWTGGQIADDDSAEDIKKVDLSQVGTALFWVCYSKCYNSYIAGTPTMTQQMTSKL
jgi:hypothetical protein